MSRAREVYTIADWLGHGSPGHRPLAVCCCGLDVGAVGIPSLVYVFETCLCPEVEYPHLVERLHHRECFIDSEEVTG